MSNPNKVALIYLSQFISLSAGIFSFFLIIKIFNFINKRAFYDNIVSVAKGFGIKPQVSTDFVSQLLSVAFFFYVIVFINGVILKLFLPSADETDQKIYSKSKSVLESTPSQSDDDTTKKFKAQYSALQNKYTDSIEDLRMVSESKNKLVEDFSKVYKK